MAAIDTLLIDRGPGETRVAVLSGERVIEVYHHRHGLPNAGALYRGRAGKPLPNAGAVFVDIGLDQPALMACGQDRPHEGAAVDVRVVQPPRTDKGAKVALADPTLVASALETHSGDVVPPTCLRDAEHPIAFCAARYGDSLQHILVTPGDADNAVALLVGNRLQSCLTSDSGDLFSQYGVDEAIERALEPDAPFMGGGKLIIEPTAAFVAVDVDAGPMSAADANVAALDALAYEVRLRGLSGPIIVDLIPSKERAALAERFKRAVADDPVRTQVSGLTLEGRLEVNRRRSRPSLADSLLDDVRTVQPACFAVAFDALRQCVRAGLTAGSVHVALRANDAVITVLRGPLRSALSEAERALKTPISLQVADGVRMSYIDIMTS